jgi:ribonuclease P protein component
MLAAAWRLRRRDEFTATIRGGRRGARGTVVVHLTVPAGDERSTEVARAGFVVPKAVGGAVARNRVRRRLRHLMRDRLAALPPGAAVVVRALPGATERDYPRLSAELDAALAAALARTVRPS